MGDRARAARLRRFGGASPRRELRQRPVNAYARHARGWTYADSSRARRQAADRRRPLGHRVRQRRDGRPEGHALLRRGPAPLAAAIGARRARALRLDLVARADPLRIPWWCMDEIGLFPLGIVLLPRRARATAHLRAALPGADRRVPREPGASSAWSSPTTRACVRSGRARASSTCSREFEDGRLNVVVEGGVPLPRRAPDAWPRVPHSAVVTDVPTLRERGDAHVASSRPIVPRARRGRRRRDGAISTRRARSWSFELAAQVELPADAKQQLLELTSEQQRLVAGGPTCSTPSR